jgi:predicted RND superfamily exporter protein
VEGVLQRYAHPSLMMEATGPLWLQSEAIRYSRIDLKHVTAIALITMLLILGFAFRSVRGTLGPMLVALITVSITLGIIALAGIPLSQFALIALPVLVGLGILDSVHIVHAYNSPPRNLPLAPCLWTSITTLIGFIVLVSSPIAQVRSIGLVIAIGVPISFGVSFTFLPAFLMLGRGAGRRFAMHDPFEQWATKISSFVERRARSIVMGFIIIAVIVSSGIALLHIRLDFPNLFRTGTPAHTMLDRADKVVGGAASIEVVLDAKHPQGFTDPQTLQYAANFLQGLSLSSNVAGTTSFLDAGLSALIVQGVDFKGMRLGDDRMKRLIDRVRSDADGRALLGPWITDDFKKARVHVKLTTRTPEHFDKLDAALKGANKSFGDWFSVIPTGFGYLYKAMEKVMLESFLSTFIYALIGVCLTMMFVARRRRLGIASVLANLLPIGMVLGLMGWLGVGISIGVIILPAVGLGLLADDTIHFMMALKRVDGSGREAIERALRETGWPLVMTQLILLAVFGSLIASHFESNVTLGIFMCFLLFMGLAFDLLFVPAFALLWKCRQ